MAVLLLFFCYRLWNLGITHTDDAGWFLHTLQGNWRDSKEMAIFQGRIWAFVSGPLVNAAMYLHGTVAGEVLRVGSLATFFVLFYNIVSIYLGRSIALMAAVLNLALYAMRWEGSMITTYPAFFGVLSSFFLFSVWLSWRYANNGRLFFLSAALVTFFVSLFMHEGVSVLFAGLFTLTIFASHYFVQQNLPSIRSVLDTATTRRQLVGAVAVIGLYFSLYLAWRWVFPSGYGGNSLTDMSIARVFPTLLGLTTSGSVLSDLVVPYNVRFGDPVMQDGYTVTYSLLSYIGGATDGPAALLVAMIVILVVFLIGSGPVDQPGHTPGNIGWFAAGGIFVGVLITFVPILPVALTGKYQQQFFEASVHSYVYTGLSHFGITLVIASLVLWLVSLQLSGTTYRTTLYQLSLQSLLGS